MISDAVI